MINARFLQRLWHGIWHVSGSLELAPGQSSDDAFARLDPLFDQFGTTHDRSDDKLTFQKKDQAAQDKMAVFDDGVLRIAQRSGGSVLHYRLTSRILLFCFFAPLLFLGFAQLTTFLDAFGPTPIEKAEAKKKADERAEKMAALPQNPIDKALGAPAPEKPKKKTPDKSEEDDDKPSPTAAYVFAGLFAALYVIGRIFEDQMVKRLFRRHLSGTDAVARDLPRGHTSPGARPTTFPGANTGH